MKFCIHCTVKRPNDATALYQVINDIPADSAKKAEAIARKSIAENGGEYVSTVRIIDTTAFA